MIKFQPINGSTKSEFSWQKFVDTLKSLVVPVIIYYHEDCIAHKQMSSDDQTTWNCVMLLIKIVSDNMIYRLMKVSRDQFIYQRIKNELRTLGERTCANFLDTLRVVHRVRVISHNSHTNRVRLECINVNNIMH